MTDQIGTLEASVASGAEVKANLELQLAKVQAKNNLTDKEVKQLKDQLLALNSKLEVANKVLEPQNLDVLKSRTSLAKEMKEKMSQLEGENKELVHSLASAKARLTTSKDDVAQVWPLTALLGMKIMQRLNLVLRAFFANFLMY